LANGIWWVFNLVEPKVISLMWIYWMQGRDLSRPIAALLIAD
jgi:hypothetical protein